MYPRLARWRVTNAATSPAWRYPEAARSQARLTRLMLAPRPRSLFRWDEARRHLELISWAMAPMWFSRWRRWGPVSKSAGSGNSDRHSSGNSGRSEPEDPQ